MTESVLIEPKIFRLRALSTEENNRDYSPRKRKEKEEPLTPEQVSVLFRFQSKKKNLDWVNTRISLDIDRTHSENDTGILRLWGDGATIRGTRTRPWTRRPNRPNSTGEKSSAHWPSLCLNRGGQYIDRSFQVGQLEDAVSSYNDENSQLKHSLALKDDLIKGSEEESCSTGPSTPSVSGRIFRGGYTVQVIRFWHAKSYVH